MFLDTNSIRFHRQREGGAEDRRYWIQESTNGTALNAPIRFAPAVDIFFEILLRHGLASVAHKTTTER